jgi:hypothetical protein
LNISEQNINGKGFEYDFRFGSSVFKVCSILFAGLFLEDLIVRFGFERQSLVPALILIQGNLCALYLVTGLLVFSISKHKENTSGKLGRLYQLTGVSAIAAFVATMYNEEIFFFFTFVPIMFISIYYGFRKSIPYAFLSWITQSASRLAMVFWLGDELFSGHLPDKPVIFAINAIKYIMFLFICYVCDVILSGYRKSQKEDNILIESLGDKCAHLEQAKKEIQNHFNKLSETNKQLEQTNSKLASSLGEFYTLQQISQAITSIFDMNELLKFVNDVIIGVMGAYHSTIALSDGPQNRLKVQVSSIFDKNDLAVLSDYISCEALKPSINDGSSMVDNAVTPDEYPFTKGRGIQSLICVPLLVKGRTIGIVLIEHSLKDAFHSDSVRLLEIITQQVSIAIENTRLYKQMHDLATKDGLTGAYNRIYFQDTLEIEYMKAQKHGYDLSLVIFDIDYFKNFNDTYGHLFGDLVLNPYPHILWTILEKKTFSHVMAVKSL